MSERIAVRRGHAWAWRLAQRIAASLTLASISGVAHAQDANALVAAIRGNDVASAQAALTEHADPNQRLDFGATPLGLAVNTQNPAMVALLLAKGAKPNVADIDGVTPLALACELGDGAIVSDLLDAHADVRHAAPDGTSPLAICARFGPPEAVAHMLAQGALADAVDSRGQTPLMWAASSGRTEAIVLLVKAKADVNRVSKGGLTPLFFAIKSGVVAATETLLAAGARADYRGPENTSAAQIALYHQNYGAAALLVARGADLSEHDRTGAQLLHAAAAGGDPTLITLLLAKGADPNALTGPSHITWVTEANFGIAPPPVPPTPPLLIAAANGHDAAMRLLLAAGANPHFVAADGTNVVLAAARGPSPAALDLALRIAPDVNVADARGQTALHILVGGGMRLELDSMMDILAAHHARADLKNKSGMTAASIADGGLTEIKAIFHAHFADWSRLSLADAGGPVSHIARPE